MQSQNRRACNGCCRKQLRPVIRTSPQVPASKLPHPFCPAQACYQPTYQRVSLAMPEAFAQANAKRPCTLARPTA
jgi:hypothetical protein